MEKQMDLIEAAFFYGDYTELLKLLLCENVESTVTQ